VPSAFSTATGISISKWIAEMILFGHTKPDARVTLAGEPVKLVRRQLHHPSLHARQTAGAAVVAASPDGR